MSVRASFALIVVIQGKEGGQTLHNVVHVGRNFFHLFEVFLFAGQSLLLAFRYSGGSCVEQ